MPAVVTDDHGQRPRSRGVLSAPKVPLIGMTWFEGMDNWAEKKGGAAPVKIRAPEMM